MLKNMKLTKKILSFIIAFVIIFSIPGLAKANDIESIDIKVELQEDASAIIKDHRIFNAKSGTEHFISLGSLGNSEVTDFKVFDENGSQLEDIGSWDVSASLEEKAGKYGINYSGSEVELCFGLGSYGRKDFTIEYRISNFVKKLTDGKEVFYWQFLNPDMDPIEKAQVTITNNKSFKFEYPETKMWAFGFEGDSKINPDSLFMETKGSYRSNYYMTMLSILPEGTFNATDVIDYSSKTITDKAMEGATLDGKTYDEFNEEQNNYDDSQSGGGNWQTPFTSTPFFFIAIVALINIFFSIFGIVVAKRKANSPAAFSFKATNGDEYYRDIPYNGNFIDIQWITNSKVSNYVSAFILKWVNEGRLQDQVETGGIIFSKEKLALKIVDDSGKGFDHPLEKRLWDIIVIASGDDRILSEKEFNKYIRKNISKFNSYTDTVRDDSRVFLEEHGFIHKVKEKFMGLFSYNVPKPTNSGQELINNMNGFKNYLKDFSLIHEREVSNVKLWKDYLVWAAFLGISKEVYEQLKIVDPQVEQHLPYSYNTILLTNSFANSVQSTQSSMNTSSSSFSGGGGSSCSGGGGGSFGGGSGGGTR